MTDELGLPPDDPRGLTVTGGFRCFGAPSDDPELLEQLSSGEPAGLRVLLRTTDHGNRAPLGDGRT